MTDQPGYEDLDMRARYATQHFAEADEQGESADLEADIESNELHAAAGQTCTHCGKPIAAGADVRKTLKGGYVHELCP